METYGMQITSRICANCGTEILEDVESGAKAHRDITYDAKCRQIMAARRVALRNIDRTGNAFNFGDA